MLRRFQADDGTSGPDVRVLEIGIRPTDSQFRLPRGSERRTRHDVRRREGQVRRLPVFLLRTIFPPRRGRHGGIVRRRRHVAVGRIHDTPPRRRGVLLDRPGRIRTVHVHALPRNDQAQFHQGRCDITHRGLLLRHILRLHHALADEARREDHGERCHERWAAQGRSGLVQEIHL